MLYKRYYSPNQDHTNMMEPGQCYRVPFPLFIKLLQNSCEFDELNGWFSTLQAAWRIGLVCSMVYLLYSIMFVNSNDGVVVDTQLHKLSVGRSLSKLKPFGASTRGRLRGMRHRYPFPGLPIEHVLVSRSRWLRRDERSQLFFLSARRKTETGLDGLTLNPWFPV